MRYVEVLHPDEFRVKFPEPPEVHQSPQGLAFDVKYLPMLKELGVNTIQNNGWLYVAKNDLASYAKLRLAQIRVGWVFDSYPYPGSVTPYAHQKVMFDLLVSGLLGGRRLFNLSEMATGKTYATVWALHAMLRRGLISKVLILSTKSTLYDPWLNTWFNVAPSTPMAVLDGSKPKRQKLIASGVHSVLVANHHAVNSLRQELKAWNPDVVVIDEATIIKTATAVIHKSALAVTDNAKGVVLLTGTPTANSLLDSHGLLMMGRVPGVPTSVASFKQRYGFPTGPYSFEWFQDAQSKILGLMYPSVAFRKNECIDLPPQIDVFRDVGMSDQQRHAYNDLVGEFVHEAKRDKDVFVVTALNALALMTKLLQVASGVVKGTTADGLAAADVVCAPSEKLEELERAIESTDRKVLVFASYKAVIFDLCDRLAKRYGEDAVAAVTGEDDAMARGKYIAAFQDKANPLRIIVAHPQVLALGVTMTAADITVWYSPTIRTEFYLQGRERISRPGQEAEKTTQLHILCSEVERDLYARQRDKVASQDILLTAFQRIAKAHGVSVVISGRDSATGG